MFENRKAGAIRTFSILVLLAVAVGGCSSPTVSSKEPASTVTALRNNAASLLYDLLGDEQNVSKLLIIKRDRAELHRVIKNISTNAAAASKTLERMAAADGSLDLKSTALPPGETATREAIAKTKTSELLRASGADFEFKLLMTQTEALHYAEHLAKVAAASEVNPEHAAAFRNINVMMKELNEAVLVLLRSGMVPGKSAK